MNLACICIPNENSDYICSPIAIERDAIRRYVDDSDCLAYTRRHTKMQVYTADYVFFCEALIKMACLSILIKTIIPLYAHGLYLVEQCAYIFVCRRHLGRHVNTIALCYLLTVPPCGKTD